MVTQRGSGRAPSRPTNPSDVWRVHAAHTPEFKLYKADEVDASLAMAAQALRLKNSMIADLQARLEAALCKSGLPEPVHPALRNAADEPATPASAESLTGSPGAVSVKALQPTSAGEPSEGKGAARLEQRAMAADLEAAKAHLSSSQAEMARLSGSLAERNAAMQRLQEEVEGLMGGLAQRDTAIKQLQREKAEAEEGARSLAVQLSSAATEVQDARAQLAGSQAEMARLKSSLADRSAAVQQLEREVEGLQGAIAEREAAIQESKVQAARSAEQLEARFQAAAADLLAESQLEIEGLKAGMSLRGEAIVQLQQARAQAEEKAEALEEQLRAREAELEEARAALAQGQSQVAGLTAGIALRDEAIVQLQQAKAEVEAAMEVRQAEQVQLLGTLQQYLLMCDSATAGVLEIEEAVPTQGLLEGAAVASPATAGLGTPVAEPGQGPPGSDVDLPSPNSAERVLHFEQRLEFWHQRLASAAKLRSVRWSPANDAGSKGGGGSGDNATVPGGEAQQQQLREGAVVAAGPAGYAAGAGGSSEDGEALGRLEGAFSAVAAVAQESAGASGIAGAVGHGEGPAPARQTPLEWSLSEPLSEPSFDAGDAEGGAEVGEGQGGLGQEGEYLPGIAAAAGEEPCKGKGQEEGGLRSPYGSRAVTPPRPIPAGQRVPGELPLESHPIELSPSGSTWLGSSVGSGRQAGASGAGTPVSGGLRARGAVRSLPAWPETLEARQQQQQEQQQQAERPSSKVSVAPRPSILGTQAPPSAAAEAGRQQTPPPAKVPTADPAAAPSPAANARPGSSGPAFSYRPASRVTQLPPSPTKPQHSSCDGGQAQPLQPPQLSPQLQAVQQAARGAAGQQQAPEARRSLIGSAPEAVAGGAPQLSERLASALAAAEAQPQPRSPAQPSPGQQQGAGRGRAAGARRAVPVAVPSSMAGGGSRKGPRALRQRVEGEEELDIQGAFATELLDRLNIHSPKKSGSSSRAAFL